MIKLISINVVDNDELYQLVHQIHMDIDGWIDVNEGYFIKIVHNDCNIGLFQLIPITRMTSIIHLHLLSEYQNKGLALKCLIPLLELIQSENLTKVLLATIPMKNESMKKVIMKTPFRVCGCIPNGITYKNELQDLILFQLEVK